MSRQPDSNIDNAELLATFDTKMKALKQEAIRDRLEPTSARIRDQFHKMFSNLHPTIAKYLELRKNGQLPKKPDGMENFYQIADSFRSFVESMEYWDLDAEDNE